MTLGEVIDDGFLRRYRELLDAEDAAFDDLEHAYEEGNRVAFETDLAEWREAFEKKIDYLQRRGVTLSVALH